MNPKVFVSHASEDKERFVLDFATKLRGKGIDAWLDKWEILPGDSLIDKIFEEGIKDAQAVIIVVSQHSVNKKWVREELNAAVVKKINGISKLKPVVIDDCEVPEALQSTVWVKIKDLNNYEAEFESIVRAIYEQREKPPIGEPPAYARTFIDVVPGLMELDSQILKLSCERIIERQATVIHAKDLLDELKSIDVHEDDYFESLEILHSRGYIKGHKVADGTNRINRIRMTTFGFDQYAKVYIDDYDSIFESVGFHIVNNARTDSHKIAASLNQPLMLINHILDVLENNELIKLRRLVNREHRVEVAFVSPELKRRLQ